MHARSRGLAAALAAVGVVGIALATGCKSRAPKVVETPFGFLLHDERPVVVEATSRLGRPLLRPGFDAGTLAKLSIALDDAWETWAAEAEASPDGRPGEMAYIWLGRRLAYLGRYRDAISVFSAGLRAHPDSVKLLRHRGHRAITVRDFDRAVADLGLAWQLVTERGLADEVEPDGAPNAMNIPLTTTHSNIIYHLALALYLRGEYQRALEVQYAGTDYWGRNDDGRVSSGYWVYRTQRKLGDDEGAAAHLRFALRRDMQIIENQSYHRLLLAYRDGVTPDTVGDTGEDPVYAGTVAYGLAAELEANGYDAEARKLYEQIVAGSQDGSASWASFGYIAAETELARLRRIDREP